MIISPPDKADPEDAIIVDAKYPRELSGVASIEGGYAVVGDETNDHGRIWPGGAHFELPGGIEDPESIDVTTNPSGETLWLVLGEKRRRLKDFNGGDHIFGREFAEVDGRGLEGLTARWHDSAWQIAVVWEGGYYNWKKSKRSGEYSSPRVTVFEWIAGEGVEPTSRFVFDLAVQKPSKGQRFRAPDLVWNDEGLLVLLASTDQKRKKRKHTWLQQFDLAGTAVGQPLKLEDRWKGFCKKRNWEALDRTLDGKWLVIGHDQKKKRKRQILVAFPYPA